MRGVELLVADDGMPGSEQYEIEDEIGHGAFSEVHRAKSRATGEIVALKHMCYGEDGRRPAHAAREIAALTTLAGHPHIVQLRDLAEARYSISLVLQHCMSDLDTVLRARKGAPLPLPAVKVIAAQLFSALAAVHAAGLAHRDVSPGNILFDDTGAVRLSDFGQARSLTDTAAAAAPPGALSPAVGTRWYRAPELLFSARQYTTAVDMWAAGCILAELLTGRPLFPGSSDLDQLCKVREVLGSLTEEVWPGVAALPDWGKLIFPPLEARPWSQALPEVADPAALALVGALVCYDPEKRLTAAAALQHEFFAAAPAPATPAEVAELVAASGGRRRTSPKSPLEGGPGF